MAGTDRGEVKQSNGEDKQPIQPTGGKGGSKTNPSTSTATGGKGTGAGSSDTRTATDGSGKTTAPEKGISGLATVNEPPQPELKKAPKKRTRTTKKNDSVFNEEQLTALIMSISSVFKASDKDSVKLFALSESEAKQIATPLSKLIINNDSLKGLTEHSDSIALVTACLMIMIPRLVIFAQLKKQEKKLRDQNVKIMKGTKTNEQKGQTDRNSQPAHERATHNNANGGQSVLSILPSIT